MHHHTIQINQPTRCNNLSSLLLDVYLQLNMFWASPRPSLGAQQLQQQPLVLPSERGDSSAIGRGRAGPGRPDHDQQHCYHQAPKVKLEAATAVVELLMLGVRTPETCWAVNKQTEEIVASSWWFIWTFAWCYDYVHSVRCVDILILQFQASSSQCEALSFGTRY